jgi:hypothetical protein|tara:strand:- start:2597 stop:3055 length:459 start_codon:yes stop_codon:yes gene_type:complete
MDELVDSLKSISKTYQAGCLAFFGSWFGGIADGTPQIKDQYYKSNIFHIEFSEGELLKIYDPEDIEILADALVIWRASQLEWYWNSYGEVPSPDNRRYYKFKKIDEDIYYTTNREYPIIPKEGEPAFELAWFVPGGMGRTPYHRDRGKIRQC